MLLDDHYQQTEFIDEDGLYEIYSNNCFACKMQQEILDDLQDNIELHQLNIENVPLNFLKQSNITSIPTFLMIQNGQVIKQTSGVMQEPQLKNFLDITDKK